MNEVVAAYVIARPATAAEVAELCKLEAQVTAILDSAEQHLQHAVEEGKRARHLLLQIKDKGLYRAKAGTWDAYCEQVLRLSKQRAYMHLNHARLERLLSQDKDADGNLLKDYSRFADLLSLSGNQAEALYSFPVEVQLQAWRKACEEQENPGPAILRRHAEEAYGLYQAGPLYQAEAATLTETIECPDGSGRREAVTPVQAVDRTFGSLLQRVERAEKLYGTRWQEWRHQYLTPALKAMPRE